MKLVKCKVFLPKVLLFRLKKSMNAVTLWIFTPQTTTRGSFLNIYSCRENIVKGSFEFFFIQDNTRSQINFNSQVSAFKNLLVGTLRSFRLEF